jgi:UDP-N-acetylglucosamine 3-dehydrogenase
MIKVGVIGLGAMGKNHVRVYSELPGVELAGIADADYGLTQSLAKKYHTKPFSDYKELLREDLDAVSIAVPTSLHREVALSAADDGANMLIEKPIADSVSAGSSIIEAASKNRVKLMIGHIERFNPVIPVIKKEIEGTEVSLVEITRIGPFPPRIRDVGVVIDLATHDIDLLRYITGSEFKKIYSLTSRNLAPYEDAAILLFEMENGILGRVTVNWLTPFKVRTINIPTREKLIKASLIDQKVTIYSKYKENDSYLVKELSVPFAEPLKLELQAFISSIKNDVQPPVSGEDGLKALEVASLCLQERS